MRRHRSENPDRHRALTAILSLGFAGALAACTTSDAAPPFGIPGSSGQEQPPPVPPPQPPIVSEPPPPSPGLGAPVTCVNGAPASMPRPPGGGLMPTLPSTITRAAKAVPALSGGTLLRLADGATMAVSDPERDAVSLVDMSRASVRARIALQAGDEPGRLIEDAAGRVHVVLRGGGAIATVDGSAGTLVSRRAVCAAPRGIAYQSAGDLLQVACAGGELVTLPAAGGAATRTVMLQSDLRDVVVGPGGSLLVSTFRKASVLVVDGDGKITGQRQPGSGMVTTILGMMQTRTPSVAWRMVSLDAQAGSVLMLHQTGVTDTIDPTAGGYAGLKGCGGIVQPGITVLDGQAGASAPALANGIMNASLAIDIAVSPDKTRVAMAVPGNAQTPGLASIFEGSTGNMTQPLPKANPCGTTPEKQIANVPGQVVAVAYLADGTLVAQTREPAALYRPDSQTSIGLATDSRADTGHLIFHVNAGGGLACASCHPEGAEDGRVWNFACAGARRTQSIRGGISATAPFHWDGAEKDFSNLMDDVFSGRMAGPKLSTDQKSSLQAWVDTIPALPTAAGLDAAAVGRGKALFNDAKVACASCHTGALATNNMTVDVGTGMALQVPSLRGVAWRAPYMHNGCASTLTDRFGTASCGGGDRHGATSTLSTAQLGDLTAYLQSL